MNFPIKSKAARWAARLLFVLVCLVTLFVLFHVEENWRGERDWLVYKQQIEAKGEKIDMASHIPPRVPDDQNFAMTPFLAPLFDFEPGTQKQRDTNAVRRIQDFASSLPSVPRRGSWATGKRTDLGRWLATLPESTNTSARTAVTQTVGETDPAKAATAILKKLGEYNPVLDELRAASRRPHCRFNIRYDAENPVMIMLPHLTVMRRVCSVLQLRALALLASNRADAAFDDVNLIFQLGDATGNEPTLVSHLVRVSNLDSAVLVIWEGLVGHRWSDAQLQALQKKLQSFNLLADYKRALQAERAFFGNGTIDFLIKSPNRDVMFTMLGGQAPSAGSVTMSLIPRGWFRMEQLSYNRVFDDVFYPVFDIAARRVHPGMMSEKMKTLEDSFKNRLQTLIQHRVLLCMLCPAIDSCLRKFSSVQTTIDEAAIACALERHRLANGQFPDKLDALVPRFMAALPHDIITGEPLKYRKNGDGFVLYSVGWNEKDDGGAPGMIQDKSSRVDLQKGDWVWQCPARK